MSCPNSDSPINISTTANVLSCEVFCSYMHQYKDSSCTATYYPDHIKLSYDATTTAAVTFNNEGYNVREVNIYAPSVHMYNGISADAEMLIIHDGAGKKLIVSIGIPAVSFVIVGAFLSKFIETKILEFSLAIFLIIVSLILLIFKNLELKPTLSNSIGGGIFSGLIAGLLGTGGAIRGMVLTAYNLKMEVFIATSAIIDLGIDSSRSVVYYLNGYVHKDDLYLIPILLIVSVVGTFTGKKILTRVSEKQFKSIVLILVLLTGIVTLSKIIIK